MTETQLTRDEIIAKVKAGESLAWANLYGANLSRATLDGANLYGANLYGANLSRATLDGANLDGANLYGANLSRATLDGANLDGANLSRATLDGANLDGANLDGATLDGATLSRATLYGATLYGATLYGATLDTGETWEEYLTIVVPALCAAGGVPIEEVAKHFECHSWDNCPMAAAFQTHDLEGVPILLRPRADQFIRFFDSHLIEAVVGDDGAVTFRSPVKVDLKP